MFNEKRYQAEYRAQHKEENRAYQREYRIKKKLEIADKKRQYARDHKEQIEQYKKSWYAENKERILVAKKERYERDKNTIISRENARLSAKAKRFPEFRVRRNLRSRISSALRGNPKSDISIKLIGCTVQELKIHLESQFKDGMGWHNYGRGGWHVDHIVPCAAFDLTDPVQQRQCFHYTNLQPLWCYENVSKGNKMPDGSRPSHKSVGQ